MTPQAIIWHHSGDQSTGLQATKINTYHESRGFTKSALGFFGGYHILVEKDGSLFRYRNDNEVGCHTYGHNQNTLGICLAGNFNIEVPTPAQHEALHNQLNKWMTIFGIPKEQIYPHRRFKPTDCPGTKLYNTWAVEILNDPLPKEIVRFNTPQHDPCQ